MVQIIREFSGLSLSFEQFNNDIKCPLHSVFPLSNSLSKLLAECFSPKSKTQKARKTEKFESLKIEHWLVRPTIPMVDVLISSCAGQRTTQDPPAERH